MSNGLIAVCYFGVALLLAWLQLEFLRLREARKAGLAATVDALNTGLHYVPVALLVVTQNFWVIPAEVAANFIASYVSIRRLK